MTLVCESIVLLELTQCSNITARKKKKKIIKPTKKQPASAQRKKQNRLAPWRLVSASDCTAYCFCKRLQCQARQAGDTEITHVNTHRNQSVGKTSWRPCGKSAQREAVGKTFTLLCNQLCLRVLAMQRGLDAFLVPVSLITIFKHLSLKVLAQ